MYQPNGIDLWNQYREDLLREAEGEHLARRHRKARPKRAARLRNAFLGQVLGGAAGNLHA